MATEFNPKNMSEGSKRNSDEENSVIEQGTYENVQAQNKLDSLNKEHSRKENIKSVLHWCIVIFIILFAIAAILAGVVYFWHLITPEVYKVDENKIITLHFLSDTQLEKLSAFFVTVVLSSTFTGYAKKYFE